MSEQTSPSKSWMLSNDEATQSVGRALAKVLRPGDFVGLVGTLGAGKTCLTRGLMAALLDGSDFEAQVTSPTYTLLNIYDAPYPIEAVLHADLYRLEDVDDLVSTGYWDALEQTGVAVVEWIDQIPEAWPGDGFVVTLEHAPEGRKLTINWQGAGGGAARLGPLYDALDNALASA